jgi:beta-1,2-mannobiose phosphorylase / 1,2-beta-oligomannan phosphorylase
MVIVAILFLLLLAVLLYFLCRLLLSYFPTPHFELTRSVENPILSPNPANWWESEAVFNPAAVYADGRVHLLYRALGRDGVSRIGYASSLDGIHFDERLPYPVFTPSRDFSTAHAGRVYPALSYDTQTHASGGGWGGSEDPRLVELEGKMYMTFTAFDGWGFLRMAMSSILNEHFLNKQWHWHSPVLLSPPGEINKNWMIFPEKINGKYAVLHSVTPKIKIEYVDSLSIFNGHHFINGSTRSGGRKGHWDSVVRGAGAPPLRTRAGWLLLYHGFDERHPEVGYKVGAMLLDLKDPTNILYRSSNPILESKEWYENDWKPGVTYASGVVIKDKDLLVYYGGGDKHIAVAKMNLEAFLESLTSQHNKVY